MHSKELKLIEQGLYKLKLEEAKKNSVLEEAEIAYTPVVDLVDNLAYLLLLLEYVALDDSSLSPDASLI